MIRRPDLRSQRGQQILESVLIIVVLFGVTSLVAAYFNRQEFLRQLVSAPFENLAGVMQNGMWQPRDKGAASHPSGHNRHIVIRADGVR